MSQSKTNSSIDLLYSKGVSVSDVRKYGCFTTMPVRRHDNHRLHDEVEHRLFDQWNDIIGDGVTDICFGSMNHVSGGWDSLALPEAKPERIYYTIWLTIFFFLLDDKAETLPREEAHNLNLEVDKIFSIEDPSVELRVDMSPMEKLLTPFVKDFLAHDQARAIPVLRQWRYWLQNVDSKCVEDFRSIEEYISYRTINVGLLPFDAMMRYVMELDITVDEVKLVEPINWHTCASAALTNDYWSWNKEVANNNQHSMRIMNGVTVLGKEKGVGIEEALRMLKELALVHERQAADLCAEFLELESTHPRSNDFYKYVEAHIWFIGGNSYWSSTCRRYRINGLTA